MHIKSATFVMSNSDVAKCPKEKLPEYAFIGRSNVGKSSLINMLTDRKSLAKVSGRPGKTQLINHVIKRPGPASETAQREGRAPLLLSTPLKKTKQPSKL